MTIKQQVFHLSRSVLNSLQQIANQRPQDDYEQSRDEIALELGNLTGRGQVHNIGSTTHSILLRLPT